MITRQYLDSLLIETRYMNSTNSDLTMNLYGRSFKSPIMDAFKALALGASAVCIGRPLMTAIKHSGAEGVTEYLQKANDELAKAMAYTGCTDLGRMDPAVVHRI